MNKKIIIFLLLIIALGIASTIAYSYKKIDSKKNNSQASITQPIENTQQISEQQQAQSQLDELNRLQQEKGINAPTPEEVQEQIQQLEDAQKKENVQPPSPQIVEKQLQDLDERQKNVNDK